MKQRFVAATVAALLCGGLLVGLPGAAAARKSAETGSTATGLVFFPNPVADLQNQSLTDQKDSASAVPRAAYHRVKLTNLDGSGYLRGDWANIRGATGDLAFETDGSYLYLRDDDRFEQVMGYYWITKAQRYIQSLGFGTVRRAINKESQDLRINQYGLDNSFSWDKHDLIRLGKGGVDDAEDAEVILHEYGHAIHDSQVPGFGTSVQAGSIGEGFGDYWAVTVADVVAPTPDPACVADWDAVSYTSTRPHCLRRVDTNLRYPGDLDGRIHHDGQIWSRALWDIRRALGHKRADTVILEAQFDFSPGTTMPAAARATVATGRALYGSGVAGAVRSAFAARGIL
ncbi:hypothetical protein BH18ACT15_BH18ACT15_10860 [soil metagenome]